MYYVSIFSPKYSQRSQRWSRTLISVLLLSLLCCVRHFYFIGSSYYRAGGKEDSICEEWYPSSKHLLERKRLTLHHNSIITGNADNYRLDNFSFSNKNAVSAKTEMHKEYGPQQVGVSLHLASSLNEFSLYLIFAVGKRHSTSSGIICSRN